MSFDRVLPTWMSSVSERFHTPVAATAIAVVVSIATIPIWILGYAGAFVNGGIILSAIYLIAGVTCIAFPYTKRNIFASSPFNRKIFKIPSVSLVGLVMTVSWAVVLGVSLTNSSLGSIGIPVYALTAVLFISGVVVYHGVRAYRKSKGIDIDIVFKEIPPE